LDTAANPAIKLQEKQRQEKTKTDMDNPLLITGVAGFIGAALAQRCLAQGFAVVGVDNLNAYYDVHLKRARLERLKTHSNFEFIELDIASPSKLNAVYETVRPNVVYHLAAQAGVRYSLEAPHAYADANLTGTLNVLEACRHYGVEHLLFASSSSVYGANTKTPFSESDTVGHPVSLYAASKRSGELMAHTYAHLFGIPITCLRFFTVYGPWGRPDMALYKFTQSISRQKPLTLYGEGELERDFTYVDDVVEALLHLKPLIPQASALLEHTNLPENQGTGPFAIYNIGNKTPVKVSALVSLLEEALGRQAHRVIEPMPLGDVRITYADTKALEAAIGYAPQTSLKAGVEQFVAWYREYHHVA
jgi:UDP-glucuronate 4-epimerase